MSVGAVGTSPQMTPGYKNKSGYIGASVLVGGMGPVGSSQPNVFSPYSAGLPGLSMGNSLPSASNPGLIGVTNNWSYTLLLIALVLTFYTTQLSIHGLSTINWCY